MPIWINNIKKRRGGQNNNNSSLILRPHPRQTPNWCMRPPCLWDKGPLPCSDLIAKVYKGVHTLPPYGFEPMTSYEETHVFNRWSHT